MKKYAGNFVPHMKNTSNQDEWQQTFRKRYAGNYMPQVHNWSNTAKVHQAFMKKYAGDFPQRSASHSQGSQGSGHAGASAATDADAKAGGSASLDSEHEKLDEDLAKLRKTESESDQTKAESDQTKAESNQAATNLASLDASRSTAQGGASRTSLFMVFASIVGAGILVTSSMQKRWSSKESEMPDALESPATQAGSQSPTGYLLLTEP
jgi:hypothetical protein